MRDNTSRFGLRGLGEICPSTTLRLSVQPSENENKSGEPLHDIMNERDVCSSKDDRLSFICPTVEL